MVRRFANFLLLLRITLAYDHTGRRLLNPHALSAWVARENAARKLLGSAFTTCSAPAACAYKCGNATACSFGSPAAYTTRSLAYSGTTGVFTGTLSTNQCPHTVFESTFNGVLKTGTAGLPTLSCGTLTVPNPASVGPKPMPLRGAIGFTIRGGMNVYGPMDA